MTWNKKSDLTRWNRAGLSEFRYIDGNAITYLEALKLQWIEEFDQSGDPQWGELIERFASELNESPSQSRKRLSDQYYDERRDYAWEIGRGFARSTHMLGEYINTYANEAYLSTASEWDSVQKLVAMLDYRPSPPASAATYIALLFKPGKSGDVERGFAVKNIPEPAQATIFFETQNKLQGHADINQIRLKDWNKNPQLLTQIADKELRFYIEISVDDINVGDFGVLATSESGYPVQIFAIDSDDAGPFVALKILSEDAFEPMHLYDTTLYLQPTFVSSPLTNGEHSALLFQDLAIGEKELVFLNNNNVWSAKRVVKNSLKHVEFTTPALNSDVNASIHRARILKPQQHEKFGSDPVFILPEETLDNFFVDDNLNSRSETGPPKILDGVLFRHIAALDTERIYYPETSSGTKIKQVQLTKISFAGKTPGIKSADWAIVHYGSMTRAKRVDNLSQSEHWFDINLQDSATPVSLLRTEFKHQLKHLGYQRNNSIAWSSASTALVTVLELDDNRVTDKLVLGQKVICASDDQAYVVELKEIAVGASGITQLQLSPAFHTDPLAVNFTGNNTLIYGNVVSATHGEMQAQKIVGNGDASKSKQIFELTSEAISWVSDASFSSGMRADLALYVNQRQWRQVENLALSAAEDHHYQVKINQDDMLLLCFGDGRKGRRLPTGVDNIRVNFRNGNGNAGNLAPGLLQKIVRPHLLIENFIAPLSSSGGADKEATQSMRESAPATVLALERAVSIDDFSHLAAHHSMVWQARAFEKMPDRPAQSLIEVVVVAAGGATFTSGSDMANQIQEYLANHCAPATSVTVISYTPVPLQLKLTLMVNEQAYHKQKVEQALIQHLVHNLAVENRKLGEPVFRSDIIALLEQVEGVESGHCEILTQAYQSMSITAAPRLHIRDDGRVGKVSILTSQLLYLDNNRFPLQIIYQPYQL